VSRQVIWEARAIDQAAGFLRDDPDGVREMLDAVARLSDEPRPAGSFPYWSPDRRRLRVGRYRVMYDTTPETVSVGTSVAAGPKANNKGIPQIDGLELGRRAGTTDASADSRTLSKG
jgi:mRNA interferase RelE/StbE